MKKLLIVAGLLVVLISFFSGQVMAGKPTPAPITAPIVLMETGGGVATQTEYMDGNTYVVLFEYPCSANSPDYMHVSLTASGFTTVNGAANVVISYNDNNPASYDNNVESINLYGGAFVRPPKTVEFDAAKRQLTDTTCAFWKIVSICKDEPLIVRYNYTVTYPQK